MPPTPPPSAEGYERELHGPPFPRDRCRLEFERVVGEHMAALRSQLHEDFGPVQRAVQGHNGTPGLMTRAEDWERRVGSLERYREEIRAEARWVRRWLLGGVFSILFSIIAAAVGVALFLRQVRDHMDNAEIHPRVLYGGTRPIIILDKDEKGQELGRLMILPPKAGGSRTIGGAP